MRNSLFRLALPYFDENDGGGTGAPAVAGPGGNPGTPAPGATATGTPAAPAPGTPAAGTPPANTPKTYTYQEDRSNWVPSHRVRQTTQELDKLKRDYELAQSRVAALSGVQPPKPQPSPEFNAIREQLFQVAPELKDVFDNLELLKELKGMNLKDVIANLQGFATQSWQQRGTSVLGTLNEKIKAAYGGADLAPKQVSRIARAFIGELEDDDELRARYEAGDMTIVDEFVKDYTQGVLDPFRRSSAAAATTRGNSAAQRLPRGGGGAPVASAGRTVKPADGDAFHKGAFEAFQRG